MFQDILENQNTTPGYAPYIWIIPVADIPSFPAITANSNLISEAFVPDTGKGFFKIPISDVSGKTTYSEENAGDADNPTRNATFTAYHKGFDATTSFFLDQINGVRCYILAANKGQCNEGGNPIYQVLGSKCGGFLVRINYNNDGSGVKGYTITAEGFGVRSPLEYDQAVPV